VSAKMFPNAIAYYDRIQADIAKEKAAREARHQDDRKTTQAEFRKSLQISSAGQGNRAALYHSGTIVPSPGEAAWRAETRKRRLPPEFIQAEKDAREKEEYGR
jgi:hypothetical protein